MSGVAVVCNPAIGRSTLYTKEQVQVLFTLWGCTEPIPKKGKVVLVCRAGDPEVSRVSWTERKSDAGGRLYCVETGTMAELYPTLNGDSS